MGDLDDQILPLLAGNAADCDAIVFRVHPGDEAALMAQAGERTYLRERAAGRQLWMLALDDGEHRLVPLAAGEEQLAGAEERAYIEFLRECELTAYSQRPGVYLSGAEGFHYEAPSGRHYEAFLRVGNMLNSIEAVEALCFWLVPRIAGANVVLLDSPSILALGLRTQQYVNEALPNRETFEVETLRKYGEKEVSFGPRIDALKRPCDRPPRLVFLISMVSSGELMNAVGKACRLHGFDVAPLPVFASPDIDDVEPLCRVGGISRPQPKPCQLCSHGSSAAKILPDTYTLDVAVHAQPAEISRNDAEKGKDFLHRYRDSDFVRLHRSEPGGRHHAIYLDGSELLKSSNFRRRLHQRLDSLSGEVGAILAPEHEAAMSLAAYAGRRLDVESLTRDETHLPRANETALDVLPAEWLSALRERPVLLLLDDVVITGRRLRGYLIALEPLLKQLDVQLRIVYLVGLSRPSHRDELKAIPQMLRGRGEFIAVDDIVLPNWGKSDCPWCHECADLKALKPNGKLGERLQRLLAVETGLQGNEALLWWRGEEISPLSGSVFGEGTDCELFLSVAAAVQRLRNDQRLDETFRLPVARVLDVHKTADTRYFEHRLVALILRACKPHDVLARPVEREIVEHMRSRLTCERQPGEDAGRETLAAAREHRAEIVLAAAHGKLPRAWLERRGDTKDDAASINEVLHEGDPETCRFLRHLVDG
jgi:hypothetical protein